MKTILKLVIVALFANAVWRVGGAYATFYKFKDSVTAAAGDEARTEEEFRQKVADLASTFGVPLKIDDIAVTRDPHHTNVQGSYKQPVALLPGYEYPWPFTVDIDAYVIAPPTRRGDLIKP